MSQKDITFGNQGKNTPVLRMFAPDDACAIVEQFQTVKARVSA